jgi:threonine/homoserine/homoserine lactone efflux protein
VAGGRARPERLTNNRDAPTWIVWLFRAALPIGLAWLIVTVFYFVTYPPNQPFHVVQAVLAVLTAVYLIWMGWTWRHGRPSR